MTEEQRKLGEERQLWIAYVLLGYSRYKGIGLKSKKVNDIFDSLASTMQSFPEESKDDKTRKF